jgi:hypothetical protein
MEIKFTAFFKKRFANFKKLPDEIAKLFKKGTEKEADRLIKNFRSNVLNDSLALARLKKKTIRRKRRQGFKKASTPLVGKGASNKRSYANMMEAVSIKNGYKVKPKSGQHWSGKVALRNLFRYHEDAKRWHTPKRDAMQKTLDKNPPKVPKIEITPKLFQVRLLKK